MSISKENFKILFDKHFDAIRRYIFYRCSNADIASDLAQDVFSKIWEKGMNLDAEKDKSLLYKMASDLVVSKYRREQVALNFLKYVKAESPVGYQDNTYDYSELSKKYAKTLASMPEKNRAAFLLSRNDDLKYHEIANMLNISIKAVEKRMKGALDLLKKELL